MLMGCTATASGHPMWCVLLSPPSPCPILPTPCIAALPTQLRSYKTRSPVNIPPLQHPGCLHGAREALLGAEQHLDQQTQRAEGSSQPGCVCGHPVT